MYNGMELTKPIKLSAICKILRDPLEETLS